MSKDMNTPKGLDMVDIGRVVADVLVAGSDTVATVVAVRAIRRVLLREYNSNLSRSRRYICSFWIHTNSKLQDEIRSSFTSAEEIKLETVNVLNYELAVLSEAMRLFPPAPESVRRVVGGSGAVKCGDFIPPRVSFAFLATCTKLYQTLVGVYHWAAGHNSASWKDAEIFIPGRWLGAREFDDDKRGVVQYFNTGSRNCVGQK
jgi:cytochrome P450